MLKQILNPRSKKATAIWLIALSVMLIVVTIPRFNRQDLWIIDNYTVGGGQASENLHDALFYIEQTQYFRGERETSTSAPWAFRPAVPFLAAPLPFEPMTSVNIINLLFLIAGLISLWFTISLKTRLPFLKIVGAALYVFSFGPFYWGTIGYVDAATVGFLSLSAYLLVSKLWIPLALVMAAGPFIKEPAVAIVPALFGQVRFSMRKGWIYSGAIGMAGGLLMIGMLYLARAASDTDGLAYFWGVNWRNLFNWESKDLVKLVLGLGLPFLLAVAMTYLCRKTLREVFIQTAPFLGGTIGTLFFVIFSAACCQVAAGRFAWATNPFLIPVVVIMLGILIESRQKRDLTPPPLQGIPK